MNPHARFSKAMRWCKYGPLALLLCAASSSHAENPQVTQLLAQGDAEVKALHAQEALDLFQQAAQLDPNDAAILLRISQQYSNLIAQAKTPAEAEIDARKSLDEANAAAAIAPDNPKAHLALAVAYGRLTDYQDDKEKVESSRHVKEEVDKALAIDPNDDYSWHVLGRWNYAVATLNPVLKMIAKFIYGGMPDASLEEAVRDYKKAIEIAPQRLLHHHELARAYIALGQTDLARKEWETEATLKPEDNEGVNDQKEAREQLDKTR
jgi:tetratricopeptide (TPR) repeat protein